MGRTGNGRSARSFSAHEPPLTPEHKLWRAVLTQAYEDAEFNEEFGPDAPETRDRILGRLFLRADNPKDAEALALVCGNANVPADRLVLWARSRYAPPVVARRKKRGPKPRNNPPPDGPAGIDGGNAVNGEVTS